MEKKKKIEITEDDRIKEVQWINFKVSLLLTNPYRYKSPVLCRTQQI